MIRAPLRAALLVPLLLQARAGFDPVKDVPISVASGVLSLTVPRGAHLKARLFKVTLLSRGTLQVHTLSAPTGQDEAGEPIWRGTVEAGLQGEGLEDPVRLAITYQPCTEGPDGQCFLPVKRNLTVLRARLLAETP